MIPWQPLARRKRCLESSRAAVCAAPEAKVQERKAPGSAPSSAVSRSSDSSGYLSREGGRGSRVGSAGASLSRTSTAPLRKLVHTASSSSLKNQSSRVGSAGASQEAEFQAWKRRKDYDPLAAARKSSSPVAGLRSNEAPGGG